MSHYLFLDTEVFDGHQYDFRNKHFQKLREIGSAGWFHLLMPDITRREIEQHIAEKAKEAFTLMKPLRKTGFIRTLRKPPFDALAKNPTTEDAIRAELLEQFAQFCHDANVISLPTVGVDAAAIFDDYFACRAPFGKGEKKHEFPDAFAAQVLVNWCKAHSKEAVVVSKDGDWGRLRESGLELLTQIGPFLERLLPEYIVTEIRKAAKRSSTLEELTKRTFEQLDFVDDEYAAEILDVEAQKVNFEELWVTEAKDGKATIETSVIIDFTATIRGWKPVPKLRCNDASSPEFDRVNQRLKSYVHGETVIEAEYDLENPADATFTSIDLSGFGSCVNLSEIFEDE